MQIMKTKMTSAGKRIIAVLLGCLFAVSLCACVKDKTDDKKNPSADISVNSEYSSDIPQDNTSGKNTESKDISQKSSTAVKKDETKGTKPSQSSSDPSQDVSVVIKTDEDYNKKENTDKMPEQGSENVTKPSGEWLGPY